MATLLARGLEAFPSIKPQTDRNIILLTGARTDSPVALVDAINRGRGTRIPVEWTDSQDWIERSAANDEGGKGRGWFESRRIWLQGVCNGDAATVDPALEILLGRRPTSGPETVEKLLKNDPEYTWHKNYMRV